MPEPNRIATNKLKKLMLRECPLENAAEWQVVKWAILKENDERSTKESMNSKNKEDEMLMVEESEYKHQGKEDA